MMPMAAPDTAFRRVLDALAEHGCPARGNGRQQQSRCPAHDDHNPSLSITAGTDRVLLKCHAGCDTDDILAELGLTRADLYDEPIEHHRGSDITATYDYVDEHGELLYQVCRLTPKAFRQRKPDGHGGWEWKLGDTRRVLYRLPAILDAAKNGRTIYVVEGERDVHAVENAGAVATCNPGGAGKWRPEYARALTGAHVIVVADRDQPGRDHARAIAQTLDGVAASVRVLEPAEGKDTADHLAAGHRLNELTERPRLEVVDNPPADTGIHYVDWRTLFTRPRTPTHWHAQPLLAAGRVTLLYSPGKTGKSLIAMETAAAIATGMPVLASTAATPEHVLYVDQEMTDDDWVDRLTDMGYTVDDTALLEQRLHLAQLQAWPPMDTPAGGALVYAEAKRHAARVVVIDTVSKVVRGEENSNDTHAAFYQHTVVPLKRDGIAVLVLDHTGKDIERGARGGSAKTDNVDLAFELLIRGRDLLSLRCSHARFRDPALDEPLMLHRGAGPLRHTIDARPRREHPAGGARPTHLMEKLSRYIEENPGLSRNAIETAVRGKREYIRLALDLLIAEQYVTAPGGRGGMQHSSVRPYREAAG